LILNTGVIIVLVFILLGSGLYTGLALAGVGIIGVDFLRHLGGTVGAVLFNSTNNFILAAVPMFLLLGQIVLHTGLSSRLYKGVTKWTRIIPGGLLHSNIVACSIFAAVSGSSPATAATIGTVAYSEQKEGGYSPRMITGSLAAGGTLGILIPPSINMIVYGAFVGASVGRLFAGGIIPGIIMALMFMVYIGFASARNKSLAPPRERATKRYFWDAILAWKDVLPMFIIIVVIMGSIYGGIMTPTEAAAASAFLAIILGITFGKMSFAIIKDSAVEAIKTTSMVLLLFIGANILGNALGLLRIPAFLANIVVAAGLSAMWVWFAMIILYLILGCFMDTLAMLLITLPVTYPIIVGTYGFDPIWFGVQLVILCEIGMITPPVGMNLFVIHGIAKGIDMGTIIRGILPFLICLLLGLALLTFFPDLVLFLPAYMIGK
jgi:tripartite ATP-independent transporter DctM subunit